MAFSAALGVYVFFGGCLDFQFANCSSEDSFFKEDESYSLLAQDLLSLLTYLWAL